MLFGYLSHFYYWKRALIWLWAAGAGWDWTAVRAMSRVFEKDTDSLGDFRAQDVLECAGIGLQFLFIVHLEGVGKKPLGESVSANHAAGTVPAC